MESTNTSNKVKVPSSLPRPGNLHVTSEPVLQITVGVILVVLGSMEGRKVVGEKSATRLNNVTIGFVFLITVINVFIAAFGIKLSD